MAQYGSLFNRLMDQTITNEVKVGDGATMLHWSDRHAGTIISITLFKSGAKKGQPRSIVVKRDRAIPLHKGMTDSQAWEYQPDPEGTERVYNAGKDGQFKGLLIGSRNEYYDYSF